MINIVREIAENDRVKLRC